MKRIRDLHIALALACAAVAVVVSFAVVPAAAQESKPPDADSATTQPVVEFVKGGTTVELHVRDVDLRQILQMLSTQHKTNIVATQEVKGKVTVDLYGVTFDEALDAVLQSAGFGYVRKGRFVYVYTRKQMEEIEAAKRKLVIKVFKLNYIAAEDAKNLIATAMSSDGTISTTPAALTGIPLSKDTTGGNNLATEDVIIVQDYPEVIEKVTSILRRLDVRPQQVLIEATILRATLTEKNALGIDFNALAGVDFSTLAYTSTDLTNPTPSLTPVVNFDKAAANVRTAFTGNVPTGGLTFGFVSNQVSFLVRALESVTDVVVLANPKLLVINKQRGEVMVGDRDGYITTTFTETEATQTVEFIETGTQLVVRPYIGDDGYVRMEIHPKDSTGGITADNLPFEQTTECTSNILVKDGHTIVISGLFSEMTTAKRSQIPGLGNIPLAGALFRSRNEETLRKEVIILITPHIIKYAADDVVSEQYKDDVDRIRLGARKKMMWFGRDRLAQSHMRWARQNITGDRPRDAIWNLNMALSLEPRMEEAIKLKERLTKEAIWASESKYSDAAFVIQRMIMRGLSQPVEKVIRPLKPLDAMRLEKEIRKALGIGRRLRLPLKQSVGAERPPAGRDQTVPGKTAVPTNAVTTRPSGI